MSAKKRKHEDTSVSLHPMGFEEAVRRLAKSRAGRRRAKKASGR